MLLATSLVQEEKTDFQALVVLVASQQGIQQYCFCISCVKLNQRLVWDILPTPDVRVVLDELYKGHFYYVIDISVGFYSIPMHATSRKYLGFVTQDEVYT